MTRPNILSSGRHGKNPFLFIALHKPH